MSRLAFPSDRFCEIPKFTFSGKNVLAWQFLGVIAVLCCIFVGVFQYFGQSYAVMVLAYLLYPASFCMLALLVYTRRYTAYAEVRLLGLLFIWMVLSALLNDWRVDAALSSSWFHSVCVTTFLCFSIPYAFRFEDAKKVLTSFAVFLTVAVSLLSAAALFYALTGRVGANSLAPGEVFGIETDHRLRMFCHPNTVAPICGTAIVLIGYLFVKAKRLSIRILWIVCFALCYSALALTDSRAGIISTALALGFELFLILNVVLLRRRSAFWRISLSVFLSLALMFAFYLGTAYIRAGCSRFIVTQTAVSEETETVAETVAPEETQAAAETAIPEETQAAVETVAPEETQAAAETVAPEETQAVAETVAPEETQAAAETAVPEETQAAAETAVPEETQAVAETVAPEETQAAAETAAPEETQAVAETAVPEETETSIQAVSSRGLSNASTFNARTGIWISVLKGLKGQHRILAFGTTPLISGDVMAKYFPAGSPVGNFHNSLLAVLIALGIPGLTLVLIFLVMLFIACARLSFRNLKDAGSLGTRIVPAVLIFTLAESMMESFLFTGYMPNIVWIWFMIAAGFVFRSHRGDIAAIPAPKKPES